MHPTPAPPDGLTAFAWQPQPAAAAFVKGVVDDFFERLPEAKAFADRLYRETGNRFADLICEIGIERDEASIEEMREAGWDTANDEIWHNPTGLFPSIWLSDGAYTEVGIKVDNVIDFLAANGLWAETLGSAGAPYRAATAYGGGLGADGHYRAGRLYAVERHGVRPSEYRAQEVDLSHVHEVAESFRLRPRYHEDEVEAFDQLARLIDLAINRVGQDYACDLFFAAEREYWQRRNAAARWQKARQDALGIGWANHDHHTYRSSRRHFHRLVALWEKFGFTCRERFYPGPEAGWGAQVMEQPVCAIVTFNDVDISPDELLKDFAHEPVEDRETLGTVGLWCALHGESVLQAGMHHLECTFDFDALQSQMEAEGGIRTMKKFTDFPHLKQAFTEGERWAVDPARIDRLLHDRRITREQADDFRKHGAVGSHLENLERNDGFKGFNQTGVTQIINATDPRRVRDVEATAR